MKHIFIVNPGAGQGMSVSSLEEKLKNLDIDYEIYETKALKMPQAMSEVAVKAVRSCVFMPAAVTEL